MKPTTVPGAAHRTILLVDDRSDTRLVTKWFLNSFGFSVQTARSAEEALSVFDPALHDLIVTDNRMPQMTGSEMAHIIKLRSPATPVVMYTGQAPEAPTCVDAVVQRPAHLLELRDAILSVLPVRAVRQ